MKPLEFMIEENKKNKQHPLKMIFFYGNGYIKNEIVISRIPEGLELNKHYSIADIYGYKVVDDREGL